MRKHITSTLEEKGLALRPRLTKSIVGFYLLFIFLGMPFVNPILAVPQSSLSLSIQNQQFSATIIRVPLEEVLTTLTSYGPIRFVIKGDVKNDKISASFRHLSLEESLEKLLIRYDFAIIHRQDDAAQDTSYFPYHTEVVILSRNHSEIPLQSIEHVVISHTNRFSLPEPIFSSSNLDESNSLTPIALEIETHPSEFLKEIEEVLPDTDTESLALIKQLLEE